MKSSNVCNKLHVQVNNYNLFIIFIIIIKWIYCLGGKGAPRRKQVRKPRSAVDDQKIQAALKKINVQPIQGVEEVNMFKEDGNVIHFPHPKVHAAAQANTCAIYGKSQEKELTELVPGILPQLGADSLANLRRLAEQYQQMTAQQQEAALKKAKEGDSKDDDDVPDLVSCFYNSNIFIIY